MSMAAARDYFRTPDELVLCDRLLSLEVRPEHLGIETHNSGMQSNHFPHGVSPVALPHLLTALREHRDDAIVGALGPTVCESLWTWAQWPIPKAMWAGRGYGAGVRWPEGPSRVWWPVLGGTREDARKISVALAKYANERLRETNPSAYYNFRGCWLLASAHRASFRTNGGGWPWGTLRNEVEWPLVFGASRQNFEEMRAYREGR